ncbi:hypothetical protein TRFO_18159 [Tritrichomonas foetus]|uniref:Protein kinase domain-containing protein n=1 Tax=Tritrichomonas foetus TaxID=1144522 RepID=A0A1J4KQU1_9EUKA|nr:hypothetical protein TRFO_18159 [Tritrichomonas foetus]|eukprot:OHT12164.1 hypothetical protein TRFO_18159 [Tritrichomonas foetus]
MLPSYLFDESTFTITRKLKSDFYEAVKSNESKKSTIYFYPEKMYQIDNQKEFLNTVTYLSTINTPLVVNFSGFSFAFQNPENNQYFPAIAFDEIPYFNIFSIKENLTNFSPTEKSIIAFGTLFALQEIYSHNNFFSFQPYTIFLTAEKKPKIFPDSKIISKFFDTSKVGFDFYSPEWRKGDKSATFGSSFEFGMFLYFLLNESPELFQCSYNEFQAKSIKEILRFKYFDNSLTHLIFLCCNTKNKGSYPSYNNIVEFFIKKRVCFPGTNEDEFNEYKRRVFTALKKKIPKEFYSEKYLLINSIKGDTKLKCLYAKFLSEDENRREEFIPLILSLTNSENSQPSKIFMKYFLRNLSTMKEYDYLADNIVNKGEKDKKVTDLVNIYQIIKGNIMVGVSACFSSDPKAEYEYGLTLLDEARKSKSFSMDGFYLLADAFCNEAVEIDSEFWKSIRNRIKQEYQISRNNNINTFQIVLNHIPQIAIALFICNQDIYLKNLQILMKNDNLLAMYYYGRYCLHQTESFQCLTKSMRKYPIPSRYALTLYSLKFSYCDKSKVIDDYNQLLKEFNSPYFQIMAENIAELSVDINEKIQYYKLAVKDTNRKKFGVSLLAMKGVEVFLTKSEAEEFLNTSDFQLCILYRFCKKYFQISFPKNEGETDAHYISRLDSECLSCSFVKACRIFCGHFCDIDYFQSRTIFFKANDCETLIKKSICRLLYAEDFRDDCDLVALTTIKNYVFQKYNSDKQESSQTQDTHFKLNLGRKLLHEQCGYPLNISNLLSVVFETAKRIGKDPPNDLSENNLIIWSFDNWDSVFETLTTTTCYFSNFTT